jgi:hypothetical protein
MMGQPYAADDFATIRARMEELRLERERAERRAKWLAEERWRIVDEPQEWAMPRRKWRAES